MTPYNATTALYWVSLTVGVPVIVLYAGMLVRFVRANRWRDVWLASGIVLGFSGTSINAGLWGVIRTVKPFGPISAEWLPVIFGAISMLCAILAGLCHLRAHAEWAALRWRMPAMLGLAFALWATAVLVIEVTGLGYVRGGL